MAVVGCSADTVGTWDKVFVVKLRQSTEYDIREVVQHHFMADVDGTEVLGLSPHRCVLWSPTA